MTQIYVPERPQERESASERTHVINHASRKSSQVNRHIGIVDLGIALALIALITLLIAAASRWTAPLNPSVKIDLSPLALPAYAGYSLLRMALAYLLSLIFTLVYGHIAATNRRASIVMVPLLDILQSIPILSFLPGVVLTLVALFPHSNIGLELASIILIFTSQAWNMTFSYYHAARTLPTDLQEFSAVARLRPWQRLVRLEIPASMIGLIWNSMMSWAGGWFFLMAAEQFTMGNSSFQLPGLGSYLQTAANQGNVGAIVLGLITLIVLIVLLDFFLWRPLVAWSDKFKVEMNSEGDTPTSPILDLLRSSALIAYLQRRLFRPCGVALATVLNKLQPLPGPQESVIAGTKPRPRFLQQIILALLGIGVVIVVIFGLWQMIKLLSQVSLSTWGILILDTLATFARTLAALAIGVAWTVPVGVAIGLSPRWSKRLQPVVQVVASIPATALFPILVIALIGLPGGLSLPAILLMLLGTQWYILFNVIAGAMAIPGDLKEATTIYHVTGWRKWRTLILPAIFPQLVTGLITASGGAWNASIVSEYVTFHAQTVSTPGLGAAIAAAGAQKDFPVLLAATLLMAAFVVLLNRLVWKRLYALAERRYTLA